MARLDGVTEKKSKLRHKILIADDSPEDREQLTRCLSKLGYFNVQEAVDGIEALGKVKSAISRKAPFDLIFLDWKMPALDGLSVFATLKHHDLEQQLRVIFLTGFGDKAHVVHAIKHGIKDYVVKPAETDSLKEKLDSYYEE